MNKNIEIDTPTKWLFLTIFVYFIMNGAQLWETAIIIPAWTAAPPKSLHFFQGDYALDFKWFWIIIHSIHEIIFIITLILNWKIVKRRNRLLILFFSHVAVRIWTMIYFVPLIIEFQNMESSMEIIEDLVEKAGGWRFWNYFRVGLFFIINLLLVFLLFGKNNEKNISKSNQYLKS